MLIRLIISWVLLSCFSSLVLAQSWSSPSTSVRLRIPANAIPDLKGKGWRCKYGFKETAGTCKRIILPANAAFNKRGTGWQCSVGYERVGNRCVMNRASASARVGASSDKWQCRKGYKLVSGVCKRVMMPENAEFSHTAKKGWQCRQGYVPRGGKCAQANLPTNAYWQDEGLGIWACREGFFRSGRRCINHPIPKYAQPSDNAPLGYRCRFGYRNSGGQCIKIEVPRNALLTADGNSWDCNLGFERRGRRCVPIVRRTTYLKNEYFTDTALCGKTSTRTVTGVCSGSYVMGSVVMCSKNQFFKGEIFYPDKKYRANIKGKRLANGQFVANDTLGNYCEVGVN